jgi:DNA-binding MarR family transcriptional regulator
MPRRSPPPSDAPFSVESSDDSTGFLLWQVTALWQREIRASLVPLDLTHVQFVLLASLAWLSRGKEAVTQVKLARHAKLDVVMTSQVLRLLEKKGQLVRVTHPVDPRAKALTLTRAGLDSVRRAVPAVEAVDRAFFQHATLAAAKQNRYLRELIAGNSSTHD